MTWADGEGEPWSMPEEILDDIHLYDADYQNAIMDMMDVSNEESADRVAEIWLETNRQIDYIDHTIAVDKANMTFKDHSQTIDALLSMPNRDYHSYFLAVKKNNEAYWCQRFRIRVESSTQGRLFGHFQALFARLIHPDWTGMTAKEQRTLQTGTQPGNASMIDETQN